LVVAMSMAAAIVVAAGCGTPHAGSATTQAVPATTRWSTTATVTCPQLGSVDVALPSGAATPPLPPEVEIRVGYQATDAQTTKVVAGGQVPGEIACGTVPFSDLTAGQVWPNDPPAGVAPADRLTGNWSVSATVKLRS
jgi:hypothetical protein